jgi:Holliday junction DNA helicase RuvB
MEKSLLNKSDPRFDSHLRPKSLSQFIGHEKVKKQLNILIAAAKGRGEPLGHILFHGPPGLGKTTLANILAEEMGSRLFLTSGPAIDKAGDLAGLLTNLEKDNLFFIDEIHRLSRNVEEYLYPAMENFCLDLMIDSGAHARSVQVELKPFTLIGATTRSGLLSSPLRSRFVNVVRLEYYTVDALAEIVTRSATILGCEIDKKGAEEIASRSRGTPRMANNLLRWVRDIAQLHNANKIVGTLVEEACQMIGIDKVGLNDMDKKILELLIDMHDGGPVGLKSIAASIGEEETTLAEVYEPYLISQGYLKRTPRGRAATKYAYEHLGYALKSQEASKKD